MQHKLPKDFKRKNCDVISALIIHLNFNWKSTEAHYITLIYGLQTDTWLSERQLLWALKHYYKTSRSGAFHNIRPGPLSFNASIIVIIGVNQIIIIIILNKVVSFSGEYAQHSTRLARAMPSEVLSAGATSKTENIFFKNLGFSIQSFEGKLQ